MKVEIDDLELGVRCQRGDKVTKDCSCDSKWMLETMNEVGKAIRDAHHWVKSGIHKTFRSLMMSHIS